MNALKRVIGSIFSKDKGSVTAEFAVLMPVVVIIIGIILSIFAAVSTTIRCQHTANHIAQQMVASQYAHNNAYLVDGAGLTRAGAGDNAKFSVSTEFNYIKVRVSSKVYIGPVQLIPIEVSGEAFGYII